MLPLIALEPAIAAGFDLNGLLTLSSMAKSRRSPTPKAIRLM
jgi:hypothetical protein